MSKLLKIQFFISITISIAFIEHVFLYLFKKLQIKNVDFAHIE